MNFIHITRGGDKDAFFGPLEPSDEFLEFEDGCTIADLLFRWGKFPSRKQARKSTWAKEIPLGFGQHKIGKSHFWILNKS